MKTFIEKSLVLTVLVAVFGGFPIHLPKAEAYRGGYSGGSFRGGEEAEGSRGGEAAEGSRGGEAVQGPRGDTAVKGPQGNEAAKGPGGDVAVKGPQGNVAVGDRVTTLPADSNKVIVSNKTYYVAHGVYYMPYYYGGDITYVVVEPPANE
jgi:hypothetical protein